MINPAVRQQLETLFAHFEQSADILEKKRDLEQITALVSGILSGMTAPENMTVNDMMEVQKLMNRLSEASDDLTSKIQESNEKIKKEARKIQG
jgi:hypothetical protein